MAHRGRHREQEPERPESLASGAPEAGGATSRGSIFGGQGWEAIGLRAMARLGRMLEGFAYRRLRDLDHDALEPRATRGRPLRTREESGRPAESPTTH